MPRKPVPLTRFKENRRQDIWVLFVKHKIDKEEFEKLRSMINSPDHENAVLAYEIIKLKQRKHVNKEGKN